MPRAVIFILVGPGDRELRRFADLIASLRWSEPQLLRTSTLVVVNDNGADLRVVAPTELAAFAETIVVPNPYHGASHPVLPYDRILAGSLLALGHAVRIEPHDFVMKLDTDALACAPFSARVVAFLAAHPEAGMVGTFRHDPDGQLRDSETWWETQFRGTCGWIPSKLLYFHLKHRLPIRPARLVRRWRRRNRYFRQAIRNGWRIGDHVLGGAFAMTPELIRRLRENRALVDPCLFEGTRMSDDVGISMLVAAVGLQLVEFNRKGDVFGIWYQQPTIAFNQLAADGYALIHSIKAADRAEEDAMRRDFSQATSVPLASRS